MNLAQNILQRLLIRFREITQKYTFRQIGFTPHICNGVLEIQIPDDLLTLCITQFKVGNKEIISSIESSLKYYKYE